MLEKLSAPLGRVIAWAETARLQPPENRDQFPADPAKEALRRREILRQWSADHV